MKISLCMIVKNEEKVLARCLDSVKNAVDEIIIVDTGSSDGTKDIARKYTENIYDFAWIDDFSAARNYSFSKANNDYLMWLDADDIIEESELQKIIELKSSLLQEADIIMLKYNTSFDALNNPIFSFYRERIVKNISNNRFVGNIHEVIPLTGKIIYEEIAITHKKEETKDPLRNLKIFENMIKNGKSLDNREKFYYGRELYYNAMYKEAIIYFREMIFDANSWIEDKISACLDCSKCYKSLNEDENQINILFETFKLDLPRSEILCEIGHYYFEKEKYEIALYWYDLACKNKINYQSNGFIQKDCYDYIPYIQSSVAYYKIGNVEKAIEYNDLAEKIKPLDKAVLHNKDYYAKYK